MASSNYYITTSIPYVNGDPHLGHALEYVIADTLARYAKLNGKKVVFSTGTDEHGGKIAEKAAEANLTPKQFTDQTSQKFKDLLSALDITNNRFIRTTDKGHEQRVEKIWNSLKADIYKGKYTGWYCTGCEAFYLEQVVKANNGICPDHNRKYEKIEEENYFFRLSKYGPQILDAITKNSFHIIPATKKHEILNVIKDGLEDISISRPKDKISWGLPVPGDDTQVIYVWFEALMNYITVLGYPEHDDFKQFWPASMQVIGKDILRFHGAIWPGMLLSLGLPLPGTLFVHGFVTVDGQKMSKSLGNSVSSGEIIDKYGADAFRYYFLRHIPSYGDGDFSWQKFETVYNNELANDLGNALSRTTALIAKHQQGLIGDIPPPQHDRASYDEALKNCRFDQALEEVWEQIRGLNQYIDAEKPWEIAKKGDAEHLREVLAYQAGSLLEVAEMLEPFLPLTSERINYVFKDGVVRPLKANLFPKFDKPEAQTPKTL